MSDNLSTHEFGNVRFVRWVVLLGHVGLLAVEFWLELSWAIGLKDRVLGNQGAHLPDHVLISKFVIAPKLSLMQHVDYSTQATINRCAW